MNGKAVSAPPTKYGLHSVKGAEPQVVGLASLTTDEKNTDTMKTYILRTPRPVEPQFNPPDSCLAAPFNIVTANAGVSQEVRMNLSGHKTESVNRGYTHREVEPLRADVKKIPSLG